MLTSPPPIHSKSQSQKGECAWRHGRWLGYRPAPSVPFPPHRRPPSSPGQTPWRPSKPSNGRRSRRHAKLLKDLDTEEWGPGPGAPSGPPLPVSPLVTMECGITPIFSSHFIYFIFFLISTACPGVWCASPRGPPPRARPPRPPQAVRHGGGAGPGPRLQLPVPRHPGRMAGGVPPPPPVPPGPAPLVPLTAGPSRLRGHLFVCTHL